jgi:hypothetical protein
MQKLLSADSSFVLIGVKVLEMNLLTMVNFVVFSRCLLFFMQKYQCIIMRR